MVQAVVSMLQPAARNFPRCGFLAKILVTAGTLLAPLAASAMEALAATPVGSSTDAMLEEVTVTADRVELLGSAVSASEIESSAIIAWLHAHDFRQAVLSPPQLVGAAKLRYQSRSTIA